MDTQKLAAKLDFNLLGLTNQTELEDWVDERATEAQLRLTTAGVIVPPVTVERRDAAIEAFVRWNYYSEAQDKIANRPSKITLQSEGEVDLGDPMKVLAWLERQAAKWDAKWLELSVLPTVPPTIITERGQNVAVPLEVIF
jgi:hypothetical protein